MKSKFFLHNSIILFKKLLKKDLFKKFSFKKIAFISFIFLLITTSAYSDRNSASNEVGEVRSVEFPYENKIYFGAFKPNNTSKLNFIIKNNRPDTLLLMEDRFPTLYITSPTANPDDWRYYKTTQSFPIILNNNNILDTLTLSFELDNLAILGRYEAKVYIGLGTQKDIDNATDIENFYLPVIDTFYFIGKVTNLAIDGYDDFVFFDSVFINQKTPFRKEWRVRNTLENTKINAIEQSFSLLSPSLSGQKEFFIEEKTYPITFETGDNSVYKSWQFSYYPYDTFKDSAIFKVFFQPEPENPGKIDSTSVKLYGVGVQHSLDILDANCNIQYDTTQNNTKYDTIDVGKVRIEETKTIKVSLFNKGNIPFGWKEQHIWDEINDKEVDYFKIEKPFVNNSNKMLGIGDKDSFEISFTPNRKGFFTARYVIMNNFKERRINSTNPEDYRKVFILRGIGVEPNFNINIGSVIDFGNISYAHSGCESKKDTTITVINNGNSDLTVTVEIVTDEPYNSVFGVKSESEPELQDLLISANSEGKIILSFDAIPPERTHNAKLCFNTNDKKNERVCIDLIAKSIPPIEADLTIPNLSNKPGTLLTVPILLTKSNTNENVSEYGTSYSFDLIFNPTLLEYNNYVTLNSASVGCDILVEQLSNNRIQVKTDKGNTSFLNNNVLLELTFKTFLGNSESTELAIENARVGNNRDCYDFMKLNLNNGRYNIDSICNLGQKLNDLSNLQFRFELEHSTITSNELNYSFTLPFSTTAKIEIFNITGERVSNEEYFLPIGNYSRVIKLNNLTKNKYYCIFTSGLFKKSVQFLYE